MLLTSRHLALLEEIYRHYVHSNEFPERQAFRDSHDPEDMELLNQLEYNLNYLKGDGGTNGGRYKFDFILFLASPYGETELDLAFDVAKICKSLYPKYKQKPIFFSEFRELFKQSEAELRRALGYLGERNFLHFGTRDTYEVVTFQESIRTIKAKDQILTPYFITKWQEDTGTKPRVPPDNGHFPPGLIESGLTRPLNSPPANDTLMIDWMENATLKRIIIRNHQEANKDAGAGAYKSALIMASSCIEGVLLAALEKESVQESDSAKKIAEALKKKAEGTKRDSVTLMGLDLRSMISLAESIGLIHSQHTALSNVAAEYRNYVHPGKEARNPKEVVFEKPEYDSTMATFQIITRDLNQHFVKSKGG